MKTLYIITGEHGSGKTLLARKLQPNEQSRLDNPHNISQFGNMIADDCMVITTTKETFVQWIELYFDKYFPNINIQHITCNKYVSKPAGTLPA